MCFFVLSESTAYGLWGRERSEYEYSYDMGKRRRMMGGGERGEGGGGGEEE